MKYESNKIQRVRLEAMDLKELMMEQRVCIFGIKRATDCINIFVFEDVVDPSLKKLRMRMLPVYAERLIFIQPLIQMAELMES